MEVDRLKSFVRLAERLHFGQTAEFLNLSQPALSKQIQTLENEMGTSLFTRDKHGVKLTDAGKLFLVEAQKLVNHFDNVYEKGKRIGRGEIGSLCIGFVFSTVTFVPRVISVFRRQFPNVEIKLQDLSTNNQLEKLETGEMNIGFVRLPASFKFESKIVLKDELVLALPHKDNQRSSKVSLQDFENEGFIATYRHRYKTLNDHLLEVCAAYGFYPKIIQEAYEFPTILALVAAGLGVALVPKSQFRVKVEGVTFRKLDNPAAIWKVGAAWRRDSGQPLTKAFLKILDQEINK